uniref:Microfibril associated protein 5 n=1 Tax=Dicentrarchus labrax TaxID=13489 RepID=A0A8C4DE06_DICLA
MGHWWDVFPILLCFPFLQVSDSRLKMTSELLLRRPPRTAGTTFCVLHLVIVTDPISICHVSSVSADCREEMYPCTRMYSVHRPVKRCIGGLCLYSLPRVYVINNEICMRTVCQQDELLKGETLKSNKHEVECVIAHLHKSVSFAHYSRTVQRVVRVAQACREVI